MNIADLVVIALKSGITGLIGNGILKDIVGYTIEHGYDDIDEYIKDSQKKVGYILSDAGMEKLKIPEDRMEYIRTELTSLIKSVKIDNDAILACNYDAATLSNELMGKYKQTKILPMEYEEDIRKVFIKLSDTSINLAKSSDGFIEDSLVQLMNSNKNMSQNLNEVLKDIEDKLDIILENKIKAEEAKSEGITNRFEEYRDKWNENMFLNDFDEEDEDAGVNIELRKLYVLPKYLLNGKGKPLDTLEKRLCSKDESNKSKMLLVLGQPGGGKSTLITWFINKYLTAYDSTREILVFRFTDLKIDWNNKVNIADVILSKINLDIKDLENKIIILDGFDEISVGDGNRSEILNVLYNSWILNNNIKNLFLLVTCRENYIRKIYNVECTYITLLPWDEEKIVTFCIEYQKYSGNFVSEIMKSNLYEKQEVFGIPIILYMTLALNITIEEEKSIVDVYDKIFALDGGIYERCLRRDKKLSWDNEHRITCIKKQIHQITEKIAIWIFENKPDEAFIPNTEYDRISVEVSKEEAYIKNDFLIGNYFKLVRHCEGVESEELYFVHRSIYEYFVAETIFNSIKDALFELSEESQEMFAANIPIYLKEGVITTTIGEYLKSKIMKLYSQLEEEKQNKFFHWWEKAFVKMLDVGMFYYCNKIFNFRNIIEKELNCFVNLITLLHTISDLNHNYYILEYVNTNLFERYICYYKACDLIKPINLRNMYLRSIQLRKVNLSYDNLSNANLCNADLSEADLRGAKLIGADLSEAILEGTMLRGADVTKANLTKANLMKADLADSYLVGADLTGAFISEEDLKYALERGAIYEFDGNKE